MTKRATLADVAAKSGLSKTAVSLILNERPGSRLSADAVERVRAAATELGYRPNPAAQSLRMGKTRTIGFLSDEVTITRFASAMIRGVLDAAEQQEHTVLIAETGREAARTAPALEAMLDRRADGIIVGLMGAKQIDVPPVTADVPVVLVNASSSTGESSVLPDENASGYAIARVLLDAGHRRIAILGDWPEAMVDPRVSATVALRFAGIERAFTEAGCEPVLRASVLPWDPAPAHEAAVRMLDEGTAFTAVLCLNDRIAFGLYQALQERGLRIPADVSVASFDDDEIAAYLRPGLTTARIPYEQMGREAVDILLAGGAPEHRLVPMPVIERESVAQLRP
ncbi:LacI family DNA-binding transcriptional regulator [Microbacteriaceae bacterium VKM Ac-2854]|nr:LacI family DNA-binding transcriptional regulator [Microbacteriaceae bacterium VKM Ac-2854]